MKKKVTKVEIERIMYQCENCGNEHEYQAKIYTCRHCGKECCTHCSTALPIVSSTLVMQSALLSIESYTDTLVLCNSCYEKYAETYTKYYHEVDNAVAAFNVKLNELNGKYNLKESTNEKENN